MTDTNPTESGLEKRGVVSAENEAPAEKTAQACCGNACHPQSCGDDLLSKAADVAANEKK